jgi:hypothetical protein
VGADAHHDFRSGRRDARRLLRRSNCGRERRLQLHTRFVGHDCRNRSSCLAAILIHGAVAVGDDRIGYLLHHRKGWHRDDGAGRSIAHYQAWSGVAQFRVVGHDQHDSIGTISVEHAGFLRTSATTQFFQYRSVISERWNGQQQTFIQPSRQRVFAQWHFQGVGSQQYARHPTMLTLDSGCPAVSRTLPATLAINADFANPVRRHNIGCVGGTALSANDISSSCRAARSSSARSQ